jgi:hypothetical protein
MIQAIKIMHTSRRKGKETGVQRIEAHTLYVCIYEDTIMEPTKHCLKEGERWGQ